MTSRARSSAGEHYLDMVGVTGSIPVVPTIFFKGLAALRLAGEKMISTRFPRRRSVALETSPQTLMPSGPMPDAPLLSTRLATARCALLNLGPAPARHSCRPASFLETDLCQLG